MDLSLTFKAYNIVRYEQEKNSRKIHAHRMLLSVAVLLNFPILQCLRTFVSKKKFGAQMISSVKSVSE